jgi:hypothetical protein
MDSYIQPLAGVEALKIREDNIVFWFKKFKKSI